MLAAISFESRANQDHDCSGILNKAGINLDTLVYSAGHGIHSITVKDIRYYFEPSCPEINNIPTINTDLKDENLVLLSAPLGSDCLTPGMRVLDQTLANDDRTDNYLVRGMSNMEKVAHGMHMNEMWEYARKAYSELKQTPPSHALCKCITNDSGTGLLHHMESGAKWFRTGVELVTKGKELQNFDKKMSTQSFSKWLRNTVQSSIDISVNSDLVDQVSWYKWKQHFKEAMLNDDQTAHFAIYLFCKVNM